MFYYFKGIYVFVIFGKLLINRFVFKVLIYDLRIFFILFVKLIVIKIYLVCV